MNFLQPLPQPLPQHMITLSALIALHNNGTEPKISFKIDGSLEWLVNGKRFVEDSKVTNFLYGDELSVIANVFFGVSEAFTILGNEVVTTSKIEQEVLGTPASFAFHNMALFGSREDAEKALEITKRVVHRMNGTTYEPPVKIQMIKDHPDAKPPRTAYNGTSAAFDLASVEDVIIPPFNDMVVPVGLRLSIDENDPYYMMVHMRSSFGFKKGIQCHQGIIDAGYSGDFGIKVFNRTALPLNINKGEYFAQVVVHKKPQIQFVELNNEEWKEYESRQQRGSGGFGSSGK